MYRTFYIDINKSSMLWDLCNQEVCVQGGSKMSINRRELVKRHNPALKELNLFSPLSVGNGEFAFSADITGFQTFSEEYNEAMPLCTQSQWGWHTTPVGKGKYSYERRDLKLKQYDLGSRKVGYATSSEGQSDIYNWLRVNPHRLHLGKIGLEITKADGNRVKIEDINEIDQTLDMWSGMLTSKYSVEGEPVLIKTCCHPGKDAVAFSISSPLVEKKKLKIEIKFPYGSPNKNAADWNSDEKHSTEIVKSDSDSIELLRILDNNRYFVSITFSRGAIINRTGRNSFVVEQLSGCELECSLLFTSSVPRVKAPLFSEVAFESEKHWEKYWNYGGMIELAESIDERALELERRIVLSQYLTAIQCAGSLPPQETGLTCNSWYGKFHLEMHWWHAAHFPLWGRAELLEKSMWWYKSILPKARELAEEQGYKGARWPKMLAHDGIDCPSPIAPLLIWQQPHPIYYAELSYRAHSDKNTLEMYGDIVLESAEFMASFAKYDKDRDCYNLGPVLIPAQENHKPETTINPTYELEYWRFGLKVANEWRKRLGLSLEPLWEEIAEKLAPLPVKDGVYLAQENCPDTYTKFNYDHPSMVGALGLLAGAKVDKKIMLNTLNKINEEWNFNEVWGWDFPMMAMTAARLGEPELAIKALLMDAPKNEYLPNGHNRQGTRADLPLYLPGNGGLLIAVSMMAAGWDGSTTDTPGFPKDGKWKVTYEGLTKMP